MKKLLTLTLALVLLFTSSYCVLGDDSVAAQYVPTERQAEALGQLLAIGVVDEADYADGNIFIKRGMAAKIAMRIYNMDNIELQDTGFTDVKANNKLSGYIYMAKNLGIINGVGNDRFAPDSYVSYEQLVKIMVSVLGRFRQAESYGGYSDGYIGAATRLGILKHFSADDKTKITIYEAAPLLVDVLETEIEDPLITISDNEEKDTLLNRFFDIKKDRGIVNADYYISRMGESTGRADIVRLKDYEITTGEYIPDLVGESITAYIKNENGDIPSLVWYKKNQVNAREVIDSADILSADASDIRYKKNSSTNSRGIGGAVVIKNGKILSPVTDSDINIANGTITLISSGGSQCDTVIIEEYQDLVIKSVYDEETVGLKNNYIDSNGISGNKIVINIEKSSPKTLFMNWDNKDITLEDLEEDDILSVAVSDKLVKIVRSDRCIAGAIEAIGDEGIVIDGEEIKTVPSVINTDKSLKLGLDALFSLNHRGYLVWIGETEVLGADAERYGYIVAAGLAGVLNPVVQIKLFTQMGKMTVYNAAEKVVFNGIKDDSMLLVATTSPLIGADQKVKEQLVRFKLNSNNEIKELSTAVSSTGMSDAERKETFTMDYVSPLEKENMIGSPAYMFASKYLIRSGTYVFTVPAAYSGDNDDEYTITPMNKIDHNSKFPNLVLYDIDPDSNVIGALIDNRFSTIVTSVNALSMSGIIEGKGACRNTDGDFVDYLDIYNYKGNLIRYTIEDDTEAEFDKVITDTQSETATVYQKNGKDYISVDELNVGDVVQFEASNIYEITAISVLLRHKTPVVSEKAFDKNGNIQNDSTLTPESNYAPLLISYCPVEKVSNYGFTTTVPYYYDSSVMLERIQFFGSSVVMLYDSQTKEVKPITSDDIRPGEDMAFIHRENRTQRLIVIYR